MCVYPVHVRELSLSLSLSLTHTHKTVTFITLLYGSSSVQWFVQAGLLYALGSQCTGIVML